jgi:thiosulfate reductase cytochrome b subunit
MFGQSKLNRAPARASIRLVKRHSILTRLSHWVNALCVFFLLASGFQIFNAHPHLYWGNVGAEGERTVMTIASQVGGEGPAGFVQLFDSIQIPSTGILGVSAENGMQVDRAFPAWATLPSSLDLAEARHWHFFLAWLLVTNGLIYLVFGIIGGHLYRDIVPRRGELRLRHIHHEIVQHLLLRFPQGEAASHYNTLQKLTYFWVIFAAVPLMVLTGLAMSPGMDATFHGLSEVFGGRQSARTIHFLIAASLLAFVVVHLAMVILSGAGNNIRSMITGKYAISLREGDNE